MTTLENLNPQSLETPPLNAMRAFEAAARLGGVAPAAAELGVTSGAVSQQIRLLETVLGTKLVTRAGRGMALTAEGRAVAELIAEPFRGLREAGLRLGRCDRKDTIRLGAPGAFAGSWLARRLSRFEREAGGFPVRLVSDPDPAALDRFQIDLEVRYARRGSGSANAVRLLSDSYALIGAPALLHAARGDRWRDCLRTAALIQSGEADAAGLDWRGWLARRRITREDAHLGDRFTTFGQAVNAAAAGRGLAIAPRSLCECAIAAGRLAVLSAAGVEAAEGGYDLIWPEGRGLRAPGRALKTFLMDEARPFETAGV
ncbi:MAG: LysR substrate-binding domain-containing protein [Oceanicaulis sp.]